MSLMNCPIPNSGRTAARQELCFCGGCSRREEPVESTMNVRYDQCMKRLVAFVVLFLYAVCAFCGTAVLAQDFTADITQTDCTPGMPCYNPSGIAIDPTSHELYVADTDNNRVIRYSSVLNLPAGTPPIALAVFGQRDFSTNQSNEGLGAANRSSLSQPSGLFVDSMGTLWIADTANDRVVYHLNAALKSNGSAANGVFDNSQTDGMAKPKGVYVDADGTLWVVDYGNSRVLWFNRAGNMPSKIPSGQFTNLTMPQGICGDGTGGLYVSESGKNRVVCLFVFCFRFGFVCL